MKIPTPIITLIVGVALAASLFFSSMTAVSAKKAAIAAASASAAANAGAASTATTAAATSTPSAAQPTGVGASATTARSPSASPSPTTSLAFVIPPHANYAGKVHGDEGSVAIVVHDNFAIAYFC